MRGHDLDRERISIVECGGKGNIPLFAKISQAVGVPFVAVHDRDAPAGAEPSESERLLNAETAAVAGDERVELAPDFEGVAGIHGDRHKPGSAAIRGPRSRSDPRAARRGRRASGRARLALAR